MSVPSELAPVPMATSNPSSQSTRNDPCYIECTRFDRHPSGYQPVPATERPPPYTTLEAGEAYQPGPSAIPLRTGTSVSTLYELLGVLR